MTDNLFYYAQGAEVPAEARREFRREGGFSGTDINAMWRIKTLTRMFGPAGIGWYTETTKRWTETYDNGEMKAYCDIVLYIRDPDTGEWSKPITGTGGNSVLLSRSGGVRANDEVYKMAETDALGSACKKLGIGASVYWSSDRTKYTLSEDGTVDARTPTAEEVRADNRARKAQQAKTDGFFSRPSTAPQSSPASVPATAPKLDRSQVDVGTARVAISKLRASQPDNALLAEYTEEFGRRIGLWPDARVVDCYLDLRDEGVIE